MWLSRQCYTVAVASDMIEYLSAIGYHCCPEFEVAIDGDSQTRIVVSCRCSWGHVVHTTGELT